MTENSKITMTESTKKILEEELDESCEELTDDELIQKVNASNKVAATMTESGKIKVRQVLNG